MPGVKSVHLFMIERVRIFGVVIIYHLTVNVERGETVLSSLQMTHPIVVLVFKILLIL